MNTAAALVRSESIRDRVSAEEWGVRVELAACYRLMAHFGLTDLIYNHITARIPGPAHHILINSYGMLYEEITASSLQKIDLAGNFVLKADNDFGVNGAGYIIHSAVHSGRHDAGCVIHTHSRAATAVSAMKCGLLPISQSATLFYDEVSYHDFEGPAVELGERERLIRDLGTNDVMLLRNHGTLVLGRTISHAFLKAYQLENACRIQVDALAGGDLVIPHHDIAAKAPEIGRNPRFSSGESLEWAAMLRMLDRKYPGYAE